MKLRDFKTAGKGKAQCLVVPVADKAGAWDYELRIAGPAPLVKRVFGKTEFAIEIDPHRDARSGAAEVERLALEQQSHFKGLARLEDVPALGTFKPAPRAPAKEKTVFVSLQRVRGEGTFWGMGFPYSLPTGATIVLLPPPVFSLVATVTPATGDQDLFLNSIFGPLLMSSIFGGTTPDRVTFSTSFPFPIPGLLRVTILGFAAGNGAFSMIGFS